MPCCYSYTTSLFSSPLSEKRVKKKKDQVGFFFFFGMKMVTDHIDHTLIFFNLFCPQNIVNNNSRKVCKTVDDLFIASIDL